MTSIHAYPGHSHQHQNQATHIQVSIGLGWFHILRTQGLLLTNDNLLRFTSRLHLWNVHPVTIDIHEAVLQASFYTYKVLVGWMTVHHSFKIKSYTLVGSIFFSFSFLFFSFYFSWSMWPTSSSLYLDFTLCMSDKILYAYIRLVFPKG